jgi:hypothetical protein
MYRMCKVVPARNDPLKYLLDKFLLQASVPCSVKFLWDLDVMHSVYCGCSRLYILTRAHSKIISYPQKNPSTCFTNKSPSSGRRQ